MNQYQKLKARLAEQAERVLKKLKPSNNWREMSNADIQILLYNMKLSEPIAVNTRLLEALHDRMIKLTERQMSIIRLRYFEGENISSIAKTLNCSRRTIERHIAKAFKKLKVK